ncbi:hypothetical protein LA080_000754 [Diaporthe eres]|nr:hypothetical protein LA080_000754 [Diaporthe eres]
MTVDLLQLSQKSLSEEQRRHILRSALTGLASLHDRGIFHTDNKPNKILVDYEEQPGGKAMVIKGIKLSDLGDAVRL